MSDPTKPDISLFPLITLGPIADVLMAGIKGDRKRDDWQKVDPERFFAAMLRHLGEHQYGVKYDPESGQTHLAHATTNAIILLWHQMQEGRKDVREEYKNTGGCEHSFTYSFVTRGWFCCHCRKTYTELPIPNTYTSR